LEGWNVLRVGLVDALAMEEAGKEAGTRFQRRLSRIHLRRDLRKKLRGNEMRRCGGAFFQLAPVLALGDSLLLAFRALFAPVAPAIMGGDEVAPAVLDALLDDPEADGRGKDESGCGQAPATSQAPWMFR
jgi:hypothetical protein